VPEKRRRELNREWEHYHSTPEACELVAALTQYSRPSHYARS